MAKIDGQFDEELDLTAGGHNVEVGGPLTIDEGLDLELRVFVVDKEGNVADGKANRGDKEGERLDTRWSGKAPARGNNPLKAGKAIAYGSAVGADDKGITMYQWHTVVTLKQPAP